MEKLLFNNILGAFFIKIILEPCNVSYTKIKSKNLNPSVNQKEQNRMEQV